MKTKRLISLLMTLVLLLSCCPLWAAAEPDPSAATEQAETAEAPADRHDPNGFAALTFLDYPGCATVITDLGGAEHTYPGCLDVSTLEENPCCEKIASYRIELNGETLLEVTLHDISAEGGVSLQEWKPMSNGYYAVQFDLDDEQEVFLTGLTPENLEEVQEELLAARLEDGEDVSLKDIDFIDTEKAESLFNLENRPDTDGELCWAAATSNMLHYTGWGRQASAARTTSSTCSPPGLRTLEAMRAMGLTGSSTAGISRRNGGAGSMWTTAPTAASLGICRTIRRKPSGIGIL